MTKENVADGIDLSNCSSDIKTAATVVVTALRAIVGVVVVGVVVAIVVVFIVSVAASPS